VPSRAGWRFHLAFAIAVTASVQVVGVYLVFASLILPALATRGLSDKWRLAAGGCIGLTGYALGVAVSALLDWPTGAVVVWALAACALVAFLLRRRG
jgi:zinc/manganese transport system permease protein